MLTHLLISSLPGQGLSGSAAAAAGGAYSKTWSVGPSPGVPFPKHRDNVAMFEAAATGRAEGSTGAGTAGGASRGGSREGSPTLGKQLWPGITSADGQPASQLSSQLGSQPGSRPGSPRGGTGSRPGSPRAALVYQEEERERPSSSSATSKPPHAASTGVPIPGTALGKSSPSGPVGLVGPAGSAGPMASSGSPPSGGALPSYISPFERSRRRKSSGGLSSASSTGSLDRASLERGSSATSSPDQPQTPQTPKTPPAAAIASLALSTGPNALAAIGVGTNEVDRDRSPVLVRSPAAKAVRRNSGSRFQSEVSPTRHPSGAIGVLPMGALSPATAHMLRSELSRDDDSFEAELPGSPETRCETDSLFDPSHSATNPATKLAVGGAGGAGAAGGAGGSHVQKPKPQAIPVVPLGPTMASNIASSSPSGPAAKAAMLTNKNFPTRPYIGMEPSFYSSPGKTPSPKGDTSSNIFYLKISIFSTNIGNFFNN